MCSVESRVQVIFEASGRCLRQNAFLRQSRVALFGDMLGSQWSETWRVIDPVDRANWKADLFNG